MRYSMNSLSAVASIALGAIAVGALIAPAPARAQDCPGNPDALGTSRVLAIDPAQYPRVGFLNYQKSLPLEDKEVVITFDDGPLPRYSQPILDILAAQCVKVTFFMVGSMAREFPDAVRRAYDAGHTIGTHTQDHPLRMNKIPMQDVLWEIDEGIASVAGALGDPTHLSPFFRVPGFARTEPMEEELAGRSLVTFSTDVTADDWYHIGPGQIVSRAISRLEARGKGILLLHDIHQHTAAALPGLLKELKAHGFRIVHVVPAPRHEPVSAAAEPTPSVPHTEATAAPARSGNETSAPRSGVENGAAGAAAATSDSASGPMRNAAHEPPQPAAAGTPASPQPTVR